MDAVTADGMALTYETPLSSVDRADPEPGQPFPGLVVLHEIMGVNDDIRAIRDRLTGAGYAVALPDLYTPGARPLCIARTVVDAIRGGAGTTERVGGVLRWLADRPEVARDRIGVIGFCLGGGFAVTAAAAQPFRAAAVNYGRVPQGVESLMGICPVVGSYGGQDRQLLPHAQRLQRVLNQLGLPHDIKIYPGVGHSFMNHSLPQPVTRRLGLGYDEQAAEDAWGRILAFFGEHLGTSLR